ncbi:protein pelota homolog [Hydractinia symbiolongicarpus]|uniref:protein pelota homolog n=1 Tax=Hydractinia symbiolongicarpus TaxID=13093 RepID=UPI00254D1E7B|nr:protein pelota homolog [Hydractinia symbiolongicarpus]
MKLLYRSFEKNGKGHIGLIPEEAEDMWHAYNLVAPNDLIRSTTIRRVQTESATGSTSSNKIRTTLTLRVETTDFDIKACVLRVKGRNVEENQYVKMGQYHTIDLELNRKFVLTKDEWDVVSMERVDLACDATKQADLGAVVMQEGIAHVCLVTSSMTIVRAKIEVNIPRKRRGNCSQHDKGLLKFYDQIIQAIIRHFNFDVIKCVLVASPGFVKDQFTDYMFSQAIKLDQKVLVENKSKFILVHASSGFKHSLKEVLADPAVTSKLTDTKASSEVKALNAFYSMLQQEPERAFYGIDHVERANEMEAIETLLVTDELFRSHELATRKRYVRLVESVRDNSGEVKIFSSLHVSGEQLGQLSGVAAILRYPLPDLADELFNEDNSSSESDDGS